jgi:hypothetical protein
VGNSISPRSGIEWVPQRLCPRSDRDNQGEARPEPRPTATTSPAAPQNQKARTNRVRAFRDFPACPPDQSSIRRFTIRPLAPGEAADSTNRLM